MKKFSVEKTSSKGFAIGKAYKFDKVSLSPDSYSFSDRQAEEKLFSDAVAKVSSDLEELACRPCRRGNWKDSRRKK